MQTIHLRIQGQIGSDGFLRLNVPTKLPAGEAEVALTISSKDPQKDDGYHFADLAGRLAWRGDAVSEQRGMRDEW